MAVISVSLPTALVDQLDQAIARRGFAGRSEAVRAAMRDFLDRAGQDHARRDPSTATLTLVYPKEYERRIGEIRHDFGDVVKSMVHSDTDAACTEVFVLTGAAARIREFADRLMGRPDARLVRLVFTDV